MRLRATSSTTPKDQIEANPDPQKLLDQISANHKVQACKEQTENAKPAQPEREEPALWSRLD
ncbi:hypothetical protein KEM48_003102 [Puccinia striiformis f. sp. tritici PST-130]|nr:hypothetical protein H4Q26_003160 [Puccinia striiformis f. sp. tritici PST-130]KAI9609019.1 hypothetical protein KEM48_003102 [Puccinia striiformis f. sp. tritici PST-130]